MSKSPGLAVVVSNLSHRLMARAVLIYRGGLRKLIRMPRG